MARPTPDALAALGSLLGRCDYTDEAVRTRLYVDDTYIHPHESFVYNKRLGGDRFSELIRLFLLHDWLDLERARQALSGLDLDDLEGLLSREDGGVRSAVAVQPWRGLLVAHDWGDSDPAREHVIGASAITGLLADLTPRSRVGSALDVGTGSGALALFASQHAAQTIATDLNPRALKLAEWALALNQARGVELREGDLFEPVGGEQFDLVVSNPPFIVSPDSTYLFRDGPSQSDGVSQAIVEQVPQFLGDGGFACILYQSRVTHGEDWDERPRRWVEGRGCDAWILQLPGNRDALGYAVGWNRPLLDHDRAQFEATVDRWVRAFADSNTARIASGAIVLRKRSGSNWIRVDETRTYPAAQAGRHVEQLFAGQTLVAALPDDRDLLELVVSPYDGLRLDQTEAETPNGAELLAARLRIKDGVPLNPKVDAAMIEVVRQLDGRRPLRALLPDDGAATHALPTIRDLIGSGFLHARAGGGSHA